MKLASTFVLALASGALAQGEFRLTPIPAGAGEGLGYYLQRAPFSAEKPATITKLPEGLVAPRFAVLPIAVDPVSKEHPVYHVVLDEPPGKPARLFIDTNGNGDLTDDPPAEWKETPRKTRDGKEYRDYQGGGTVRLAWGEEKMDAHVLARRFDASDPQRARQKEQFLYWRDYGYGGEVTLGGKAYKAMLLDQAVSGDFRGKEVPAPVGDAPAPQSGGAIAIDANGDGRIQGPAEVYDVRRPFNIGGTTYEVADLTPLGSFFKIVKSSKTVAEVKAGPDHAPGKKITPFEATDTAGKPVKFPSDYAGSIVMIDFWAASSEPSMDEAPRRVAAYSRHHAEGFEILGVNLDEEGDRERAKKAAAEKGMAWRQIMDGKGWNADVAQLYRVAGIPVAYLVDGDTGELLAAGAVLRGDELEKTVSAALAKKKAPK